MINLLIFAVKEEEVFFMVGVHESAKDNKNADKSCKWALI